MPLIDGARLFTLSFDIRGINNTFQRFKQLAITDAKHAEVYLNCAEAFNFIKIQNFRRFKKR
jgi:CBS domain-containing protein